MFKKILFSILLFGSVSASAENIFKADKLFIEKQYAGAKAAYLEAAKLGNPHAYYQLATIHLKGLGQSVDVVQALMYFSLAAEYDFYNAQVILDKVMKTLPEESKTAFYQSVSELLISKGKKKITKQFFPEIKKSLLQNKITFEGKPELEAKYDSENFVSDFVAGEFDPDANEEDEDFNFVQTPSKPFLIVDIDIAPDGSIRHTSEIQKIGATADSLLKQFIAYTLPAPDFNQTKTHYVHRVYLGTASLNKHALKTENPALYDELRSIYRRLKDASALKEQYERTILLRNFPWLNKDKVDVNKQLLDIAKQGHPAAMYEYGLMLYREQTDIAQGIDWIARASQYGLHRAQYRLAKILQTSPWVKHDENKAFFWYDAAAKNGSVGAKLRLADLQLNAKNNALRDANSAAQYLADIKKVNTDNPEYFYLLALSYRDRTDRNFTLMRTNLTQAVKRGRAKGWDVQEWQALLDRLTTGTVTSCEIVNGQEINCQR